MLASNVRSPCSVARSSSSSGAKRAQFRPAPGGRLALAVRQAYDAARLKAEILGELRTNWNATLAADALTWLRSPAGRKVIEMKSRLRHRSQQRIEAYAVSFASTPPDPKRLAAMRQLDQATRATDISLAIMSTMVRRAIVRSAAAAHPGPASMGDFEQAIAAQEPAMRRAAETYTLTTFLYTYQELSPQELAAYLAFFDSPGGKWYQQTVGPAFQGAVEKASERFAADFVQISCRPSRSERVRSRSADRLIG